MKVPFTLLLTLLWGTLSAQNVDIKKAWVGDELEYIKIDSQRVDIEVFGNYRAQKQYYLLGDTLRLYDHYTLSNESFAIEHIRNYDFLITTLTDTNLTLMALDSNALTLTGGKKTIKYRERHLVHQPTLDFEVIKFRSTTCHGTCPSLKLQIDKEKKLLFMGGMYAIKEGYHTGAVPDSLFRSLLDILKLSELDKLKTWEQHVMDAPTYTLEVHYNGQIKYLKNPFLPAVTKELIWYLLKISEKVELTKAQEPFDINFIK
ncbi:DUF6438 domain-containing protein [Salmonirosea aquatica]|uniref:DUF6438 domain-containing protein n=1 Tax=Salmonirosea aquatica TaxID=2654236 RepID=A0A7C9BHW7_9BACT|nr:hypothetical protein [Cytophagaceae bacterium SJW1-29]